MPLKRTWKFWTVNVVFNQFGTARPTFREPGPLTSVWFLGPVHRLHGLCTQPMKSTLSEWLYVTRVWNLTLLTSGEHHLIFMWRYILHQCCYSLAMYAGVQNGISDAVSHGNAQKILLKMGEFFQIQVTFALCVVSIIAVDVCWLTWLLHSSMRPSMFSEKIMPQNTLWDNYYLLLMCPAVKCFLQPTYPYQAFICQSYLLWTWFCAKLCV